MRRIGDILTAPGTRPYRWALLTALLFCSPYLFSGMLRAKFQANYPELAASWPVDGSFSLIGLSAGETQAESLFYASRVQEAAEKLFPFDPFILENRSLRALLVDHLTYRFMGLVHLITGDLTATWILLRFLCCIFWFLSLYHIALKATRSEPVALFTGAFLTCFSYLLTLLFVHALSWSWNPIQLIAQNAWAVLSYGRTEGVLRIPRPGVTYAALYGALLLSANALESRDVRRLAACGVVGGLLAYVRLDVATIFLGGIALFTAVDIARHGPSRNRFIPAALAALTSLPFFAVNFPPSPDLIFQARIVFGRYFDLWSLPYLAFFATAVVRDHKPLPLLLGCMLGAVGLIINAQLITGYSMQWEHWRYIGNILVFLYALTHLPKSWMKPAGAWRAAGAACMAIAFLQGMTYAALHYPFQGLPRDYESALEWLKTNADEDSVVLSLDPEINLLVPAYTHSKVGFGHGAPQVSDFPFLEKTRRIQRALEIYRADAKRFFAETIESSPSPARRRITARTQPHGFWVRDVYYHANTNESIARIWRKAAGTPLERPFQIDYVWVGPFERSFLKPGFPRRSPLPLKKVYENDSVSLYQKDSSRSAAPAAAR